ncbi:hypothetical protein B0T18DRAFT_314350, partial [Schizothecium vesticola]
QVPLQRWIAYAVPALGLVARDRYLEAMGWTLVRKEGGDGTYQLERTTTTTAAR